ncbi:MAG: YbhB/YbcL family Raf kinase inhibitor-like protein [Candidatus Babeliales bacterium]
MKKLFIALCFIMPLAYYRGGLATAKNKENFMHIASASFEDNHALPAKYTCEGENRSPELHWSGVPAGTQSLALLVDDPDAPGGKPFVHWIVFNIPASLKSLPEGVKLKNIAPDAKEGKNDFGDSAYGGACPPKGHGIHHYVFTLYALDIKLNLQEGVSKQEFLQAMQGHVLKKAQITGLYQRI